LPAENFAQLEEWLRFHRFPLLGDITKNNSRTYVDSGIPIAFVFVETTAQREQLSPILKDIAKDTRTKLNFVFVDWVKYSQQAKKLGLSGSIVPALAIEDIKKQLHYGFDEKLPIDATNTRDFVHRFLSGELKPSFVSEPTPIANDDPVKIVVGSTFRDIVLDNSKDVFVEFYAPWCGHCKSLSPVWTELAELLKGRNIVVAKIDATANDINCAAIETISAYPSLYFFKAGEKDHPLRFSSKDRSIEALMQFVNENETKESSDNNTEPNLAKHVRQQDEL